MKRARAFVSVPQLPAKQIVNASRCPAHGPGQGDLFRGLARNDTHVWPCVKVSDVVKLFAWS